MNEEPQRDAARESLVRPYVVTGGRTHASGDELPIETIVSAVAPVSDLPSYAPSEAREILRLAHDAMSIAELAARTSVPVGVARVLVADLSATGLVTLGRTASRDEQDNVALLERLLDGIRAL